MAEFTAISWAHHTFNCWWGCRKVSPACRFCYAERDSNRWGINAWGSKGERRMMSDAYWRKPLTWNRKALASGEQVRVFCASMADVFEDHPAVVDARARLWEAIEQTPALTWMLLTKRVENVAGMVPWGDVWPGNVWLGVSAETQRFADQRIPILAQQPAAVRFVSAAPLLGPVDLVKWLAPRSAWGAPYAEPTSPAGIQVSDLVARPDVDWLITEGESGPKARPSHPQWFRDLRNQSARAGVPFHHKQNGEFTPNMPTVRDESRPDGWAPDWDRKPSAWVCQQDGKVVRREVDVPDNGSWQAMWRVGKKAAGRLLDGDLHDEFPAPRQLAGVGA